MVASCHDDEAIYLMRAVQVVHKEIYFDGSFPGKLPAGSCAATPLGFGQYGT